MNLPPLNSSAIGGMMSSGRLELIPSRFKDDEIATRVKVSFGDENHRYQNQALETMELYVRLFGNEPAKFKAMVEQGQYHGPFDLMKKFPKDYHFFDFDSEYGNYLKLKRELFVDPAKKDASFYSSGKYKDFWLKFLETLSKKNGDIFTLANNSFTNNITGETWDLNKYDPMFVAALSVQEDLILLEKKPTDSPVIQDISVCFPSRWSPSTAPGKKVIDVHEIVPKFLSAGLGHSINEILNSLHDAGIRFTRLVHPFSQLHQSADMGLKELPDGVSYDKNNIEDLFIRVEKQRFMSGDFLSGDPRFKDLLLMSIKTYILPVKAVKACPEYAAALLRLHERFVNEEPSDSRRQFDVFRKYRGGTEAFLSPLLDYLRNASQGPANKEVLNETPVPRDIYSKPFLLSS